MSSNAQALYHDTIRWTFAELHKYDSSDLVNVGTEVRYPYLSFWYRGDGEFVFFEIDLSYSKCFISTDHDNEEFTVSLPPADNAAKYAEFHQLISQTAANFFQRIPKNKAQ